MSSSVSELPEIKQIPVWLVALAIMVPTSFAMLATSATNVALPHIAGSFGSTHEEVNWVITSYMIANAILLPLTGWFENIMGRKNFLKIFIMIFICGSIICLFAQNLNMLILGRVIQGIGGGPMMPLSQSILLQAFPSEQKGRAMAVFAFAVMTTSILGPTVGGFLVDNLSWQWIFIINLPAGIVSLMLIERAIKQERTRRVSKRVDIVGLSFLVLWLLNMQIVLDKGQQYDWFGTPWICVLTFISVFSMIFFFVWELEYEHAIVNLRVFKDKNFVIGTILGSFINMIIYVTIVQLPAYLQSIMGYTATLSGLSLAPRAISCIVMLFIVGELVNYVDNRLLISIGFAILGIATFMYAGISVSTSFSYIVFPNVLLGVGVILTFIPISALTLGTLPKSEMSNGAGLHSLSKCVATAFITSLSSTFVARLSQLHQTYLVDNMSHFNPIFLHRLEAMTSSLMTNFSSVVAAKKANVMLYNQLLEQSKVYAFVDVFQLFALIAFLLTPLAFFLKIKKEKNENQAQS
mgnify:FL=1